MTALSADRVTKTKPGGSMRTDSFPVAASTTIYKGSLVCINSSGYLVPAADTAGFKGGAMLATEQVDNSSGAAGALDCVCEWYTVATFVASSVTQAMVGDPLYVVDDQTVDETTTNDILAGYLVEFVSSTEAKVFLPGPAAYPNSGVTSSAAELNLLDASLTSGVRLATASGTLSASNINNLVATQVTAVAAPGAGRAIIPLNINLVLDHGGTDFVQTAGTDHLALAYSGGTEIDEIGTEAQCTAFLEASADALLTWNIGGIGWVPTANEAVVFDNNGSNEYTTGDGEIEWTMTYLIVPAAAA